MTPPLTYLLRLAPRLAATFAVPAAIAAVTFWFGARWLEPGMPEGDFGGAVATMELWQRHWRNGDFSLWQSDWFCGGRLSLLLPGLPNQIAYVPFAAVWDPVQAVKIGSLCYLALAGAAMFGFLRSLTGRALPGALFGAWFAVHPIHIAMSVETGHANFPVYYACEPLMFWAALWIIRGGGWGAVSALAGAPWGGRGVEPQTPPPGEPVVGARAQLGGLRPPRAPPPAVGQDDSAATDAVVREFWTAVGRLAAAAGLAVLMGLFFIVPALLESPHHTLFSEQSRQESLRSFSLHNPLSPVDRHGALSDAFAGHVPEVFVFNRGRFYVGAVCLLLLAGWLLWHAPSAEPGRIGNGVAPPDNPAVLRPGDPSAAAAAPATPASAASLNGDSTNGESAAGTAAFFSAAALVCFWLAAGIFSFYDRFCELAAASVRSPAFRELHPWFWPAVLVLVVGFAGAAGRVHRRRLQAAGLIGWAAAGTAAAAFLLLRPFEWLAHLPVYGHLRSPTWFTSAFPALAVTAAACVAAVAILRRLPTQRLRAGFLLLAAAGLAGDAMAYRRDFDIAVKAPEVDDLNRIADRLAELPGEFRVLGRETYNPLVDSHIVRSGRPSAWSWLNWDSPKYTGQFFLEGVFRKLHRPDSIDDALRMAGWANVGYLIYDLGEGPAPPPTPHLRLELRAGRFALYENRLRRPQADLYAPGLLAEPEPYFGPPGVPGCRIDAVQREAAGRIRIQLTAAAPATLMVSESWYPGWRAKADGAEAPVRRVQGAFLGIDLPAGCREVELEMPAGPAFLPACVLSLAAILFVLALPSERFRTALRARGRAVADALRPCWSGRFPSPAAASGTGEAGIGAASGDGDPWTGPNAVAAVTILAALLRFWNLAENPLWYGDEGLYTLAVRDTLGGSPRVMSLSLTNSLVQWTLFLPLMAPFMWLFGPDVLAARAEIAAAAVVTTLGIFRAGSEVAGRRCGLAAALVFAVHPTLVLFTRWGFYTAITMPFVVWSFWAALSAVRTGDRRRLWLASLLAGLAVIGSYRAAPVAAVPALVALLWGLGVRTSVRALLLAAAPFAAAVALLAMAAGPGMAVASIKELAGAASGTDVSADAAAGYAPWLPLRVLRNLTDGCWQLWHIDILTFGGLVGLCLLPDGRTRLAALGALLLAAAVVALTGADIAANFYYSLLPAVPLLCIGAARLALLLPAVVTRLCPRDLDRRVCRTAACAAAVALACVWTWGSAAGAIGGFSSRIDAFCIQDAADARATAEWVNARMAAKPGGFVVAGGGNGWLFDGEVTNLVYMAAYEGRPSPQVPYRMDKRRFAFDCRLERARYLVTNRLTHIWELHQGCDYLARRAEREGWPLVYRRGENAVYANPRTSADPVLEKAPLIVRLPELYARYAAAEMASGNWAAAAEEYRKLIRAGREDASTYTNLAVALARDKKPAEAEAFLRRALALDPDFEPARRSLAGVLKDQGKPAEEPSKPGRSRPDPADPADPAGIRPPDVGVPAGPPTGPSPPTVPDPRPKLPQPPRPGPPSGVPGPARPPGSTEPGRPGSAPGTPGAPPAGLPTVPGGRPPGPSGPPATGPRPGA